MRFVTYHYVLIALELSENDRQASFDRLGHVHTDVCHAVLSKGLQHWQELASDCVHSNVWSENCNAEQRSKSVQVV